MIRVLGSTKTVCGGLSRREMLRAGGLCLPGMSLPELLHAEATLPPNSPAGKAKSVISLFLFGGPPVQETFDPKPDAPREYRRFDNTVPLSNLFLTLLHRMGIEQKAFADSKGETTKLVACISHITHAARFKY